MLRNSLSASSLVIVADEEPCLSSHVRHRYILCPLSSPPALPWPAPRVRPWEILPIGGQHIDVHHRIEIFHIGVLEVGPHYRGIALHRINDIGGAVSRVFRTFRREAAGSGCQRHAVGGKRGRVRLFPYRVRGGRYSLSPSRRRAVPTAGAWHRAWHCRCFVD